MALAIGAVLFGIGTILSCFNFYASFVRYPIHRLRGGTRGSFHWVSGIPLFGSVFLWCSTLLLRDFQPWVLTALVLSLFDTGGIHWFAGAMFWTRWYDRRRAS